MKTPQYVHDYYAAQWWAFIHWGLPVLGIGLLLIVIAAIWNARQSEKDDADENWPRKAGKTLDL